ncbi:MAG TPA: DNA-3-methyladenine glycosylase 2 family protein [Ornithinimicrobium sp.]|uniref:DNA-3-methyladenine glycosylase family protein n=1 Tax=Ornithinimicrobium sp. TaxID=1977084 RepID=UPI002B4AAC89|nr:DNA-3-methyladenine glycosylase 2 family protein [Ornithinimicrobium sp.]HKJ12613.1 DNA-3-methyladenine glycosylase 2 family protein [Ornithinimicrobium sp.]
MCALPVRPERRRVWRPGREVDLEATWGPLRRGAGDPTWRRRGHWLFRGISTSTGCATLAVSVRTSPGEVLAQAWGEPEVVDRLLHRLPAMLGEGDDPSGFRVRHPALRRVHLARPGWRVPRTGLVMESLIPAIVEQKVTGAEAFAGQRRLVRRFGAPAPGPGAAMGLYVPPTPAQVARIASWEWLRMGISPQRSDTVMRVVRMADRLEELALLDAERASRRLRAVPGVGLWTVAETAQRALGHADAVSFGDYHVAKNIGYALTGEPRDDAGLAELLAPYAPHRYRVQRLVELGRFSPERRGPRMSVPSHLPTR